jgi:predicted unusual protein kinase regulating ubiquinone biosynthesis (AarF/ABC1/UbiB family)
VLLTLLVRRLCGADGGAQGAYLSQTLTPWGGVWLKLLQFFSVHQDIFSEPFCAACTSAQGQAMAMPATHAKKILGDELPRDFDDVFDRTDWDATHAASMGTIWKFHLRREQVTVAVKVRPPFLREQVLRDLALLRRVAWVLTWFVPRWRPTEFIAEVRRQLLEEMDYRFEANAQRRMRRELRTDGLFVPKVFTEYCSESVLVTEWVESVPVTDYLQLLRSDPDAAAAWLAANGIRPSKSATTLLLSLMVQIYERNRAHCDLHPGNVGWLRGGRTVVFDFGATCRNEVGFMETFRDQIIALVSGQYAWAAELCLLQSAGLPSEPLLIGRIIRSWSRKAKVAALLVALKDGMKDWATRTEIQALPYHDRSLNACSLMMMRTVMRHGGAMSWEWTRLNKALTTLDGTLAKLHPTLNYPQVVRRYFREAAQRAPILAPLRALVALARRLPDAEDLALRLKGYVRLIDQDRRQLSTLIPG